MPKLFLPMAWILSWDLQEKKCNPGCAVQHSNEQNLHNIIMLQVFLVVLDVYYQFVEKVHLLVGTGQNVNGNNLEGANM